LTEHAKENNSKVEKKAVQGGPPARYVHKVVGLQDSRLEEQQEVQLLPKTAECKKTNK
jgi:hypothetical protein